MSDLAADLRERILRECTYDKLVNKWTTQPLFHIAVAVLPPGQPASLTASYVNVIGQIPNGIAINLPSDWQETVGDQGFFLDNSRHFIIEAVASEPGSCDRVWRLKVVVVNRDVPKLRTRFCAECEGRRGFHNTRKGAIEIALMPYLKALGLR